jgi:hypothetical protein
MTESVQLINVAAQQGRLTQLVSDILAAARREGADAAEVSASENAGLSVTVRLGELETVEFNHDRGFAIAVYFGHRKGAASTSDSSPQAIADTVAAACRIARYTQEDPCNGLADPALMATTLPELDINHPWALDVREAEERARREAEEKAKLAALESEKKALLVDGRLDPNEAERVLRRVLEEMPKWGAFMSWAQGQGIKLDGLELDSRRTAKSIRVRNGEATVTDGPFAETKEVLGGYFIAECSDLDQAIEIASRIPIAEHGSVEIRPLLDT